MCIRDSTGAMYRAVAYAQARDGRDGPGGPGYADWLGGLRLDLAPGVVRLDGEDIAGLIRTPAITAAASRVAVHAPVREYLVGVQRRVAVGRNLVCEGRDQGTVVFPAAECKFFLIADPAERARRRHRDLLARGERVSFDDVLRAQAERDRRDGERNLAPMRPAPDAIVLDSTHLSPEQVVERMEREVRRCLPDSPRPSTSSVTGSSTSA
jgi:cytidylate kinase